MKRLAIIGACAIAVMLFADSAWAQTHSKPGYIPQWTSYISETVDGREAEVVVDLGLQPVVPATGFHFQCSFFIRLLKPDSTGLVELKNPQTLKKIEENLVFQLGQVGAIYYAQVTSGGLRDYYFYFADTTQFRSTCKKLMASYPGYIYSLQIEHDPYWFNFYNVYPDEYVLQIQSNANKLKELAELGDSLTQKRLVQHFANFPTERDRSSFETDIINRGYEVIGKGDNPGSDLKFGILFGRRHAVDNATIQQISLELVDLAMQNGGYYDGWECEAMVPKKK